MYTVHYEQIFSKRVFFSEQKKKKPAAPTPLLMLCRNIFKCFLTNKTKIKQPIIKPTPINKIKIKAIH